ncbi:MAG: HEAT repeat domain-containing protein [Thermosynechococcaceae cyanobacterium]
MSITPETVAQALQSPDLGDRLSAVNQLRVLPEAVAFEMLKDAIADSNSRVRYAAVSQLTSLGHVNLAETLAIVRDRLFYDTEIDVQAAAADAIGALRFTEAFPDLEARYHQSDEWLLRMSIIATLGELGDPRSLPLLKEALSSPEGLVLGAAIGSLGELKDPQVLPLLEPFITHDDWQIRYRIAQALGNLGGDPAKALLETLTQDEIPQVAEMAKLALQQLS